MQLSDDDFLLFGLPRRYSLDRAELDQRRRALQAQVHPDRFASEGAAAQRLAMQWAVRVNEAYQRLKDPLRRAAYLCELEGVPVQAERNTAMPADFLLQQMLWRESLEEARSAADLQGLQSQVDEDSATRRAELARLLDPDASGRLHAAAAVAQVRALMFVSRFIQDLQHRLDQLETRA